LEQFGHHYADWHNNPQPFRSVFRRVRVVPVARLESFGGASQRDSNVKVDRSQCRPSVGR
jgi:hypothetical protein